MTLGVKVRCNRCVGLIKSDRCEICWFCYEPLCIACFEVFGHCGHPLAEAANQRARNGTMVKCAVCYEPPMMPTKERPKLSCLCRKKNYDDYFRDDD